MNEQDLLPNLKLFFFLWICWNGFLGTLTQLEKKGEKRDVICSICGEEKDQDHLFFRCIRAKTIWTLAGIERKDISVKGYSCKDWWVEELCCSDVSDCLRKRMELSTYFVWFLDSPPAKLFLLFEDDGLGLSPVGLSVVTFSE